MDDLVEEMERGERLGIGHPEGDWAIEYEQSLLPETTVFPKVGDVYEALAEVEILCLLHFTAPITNSESTTVKVGEQIRVTGWSQHPRPLTIYCEPLDFPATVARLSADLRNEPLYSHFSMCVKTTELNRSFKRVQW